MQPLGFVNWRVVNRYFCTLMWVVALILGLIVLTHLVHAAPPPHASAALITR